MIKYIGICMLIVMLSISMLFQIIAINQTPKCNVKKALELNCTNVKEYCNNFMNSKGELNRLECCQNIECVCSDFSRNLFGCNFLYKNESLVKIDTIKLIILGFFITITITASIFYSRRCMLRKMGLSLEEIKAIDIDTRGFRNKFPEEINDFLQAEKKLLEYNDNSIEDNKMRIRGIDFFGRKTLHFFSIMLLTYSPVIFLDGNPLPSFTGIIIYGLLELTVAMCVWLWIYVPIRCRPYIAPFLYGGHNRIHDRYGSHCNIITALVTGTVRTLVTTAFYIYVQKDVIYNVGTTLYTNFNSIRKLFILVWILSNNGVAFGDTAGEGVGAFLGKHRFKVCGFIGQENERSAEGCFGVFIFTIISNILAIIFCSNLFYIYTLETIGLILILGFGTMVLESISFKGTDNLVICMYSQAILYIYFSYIDQGISIL